MDLISGLPGWNMSRKGPEFDEEVGPEFDEKVVPEFDEKVVPGRQLTISE